MKSYTPVRYSLFLNYLSSLELLIICFYLQTFMLSNKGELRREAECASVSGIRVQMIQCEHLRSDDIWELRSDGTLFSKRGNKCLTAKKEDGKVTVFLAPCGDRPEQIWIFDKYNAQNTNNIDENIDENDF